jgi:2-iminobutanoate/2-iminopropanoate deaminase
MQTGWTPTKIQVAVGAAQPRRLPCNVATSTLPTAPAPAGQYTQAVEVTGATRTLYLSGQVGIASDGSVPEDAEAQCALAWRNLQAQLRAAGMEIENLVKITTIVRYPADAAKVRAGRAAVLGTHRAAGTLIIGGLSNPAWKVEVEGIAVA